ncbi:MAG: ribbon-helix-helix domain-containing protein [Nanoarchaeota archaeon]
MESITIKVEDNLAKEIDKAMKPYYSTKTEFIREAIRDKLIDLKKEQAAKKLRAYFGSSKVKTSQKEEREIREKVGNKFAKKFGIRLN